MLVAITVRDRHLVAARFRDDGSPLDGDAPAGDPGHTAPSRLAELVNDQAVRFVVDATGDVFSSLSTFGIRPRRWYDVSLAERILLTREGQFGQPCRSGAVLARAAGEPVPDDPPEEVPEGGIDQTPAPDTQPGLFADARPCARPSAPAEVVAAYLDQTRRIEALACGGSAGGSPPGASSPVDRSAVAVPPAALRLLLAAESGSALVAAEMSRHGLPWDAAAHEEILTALLGPRPADGQRPALMAVLVDEIADAFEFRVNPDSPAELREAFRRGGFDIPSTRAAALREIEHPAVRPLLRYKELARLHAANGWHWLDQWVRDGRLRTQFRAGAVVSGRWATQGGGGLQIPAVLRRAAVARPGYVFVVADAAQLEPRILAAVSNDAALKGISQGEDLYAALAADGFGGDRRHAKLAMLGAMYGQSTGEAARLMATMRRRYPTAVAHVENAARRGERGEVVTSVLGRVCPPPSAKWRQTVADAGGEGGRRDGARRLQRDRGRFTRNFVIQASAADWAAVWMTMLRLSLLDVAGAEMVLFQHDELVMHVPETSAEAVCTLTATAARQARDLVFPGSAVRTPVRPEIVRCYADAK